MIVDYLDLIDMFFVLMGILDHIDQSEKLC